MSARARSTSATDRAEHRARSCSQRYSARVTRIETVSDIDSAALRGRPILGMAHPHYPYFRKHKYRGFVYENLVGGESMCMREERGGDVVIGRGGERETTTTQQPHGRAARRCCATRRAALWLAIMQADRSHEPRRG